MKKIVVAFLAASMIFSTAGMAKAEEAPAGLEIQCKIEDGSYLIQIPVEEGDLGWKADEFDEDEGIVVLGSEEITDGNYEVRYDAVADGDITVAIRHYYNSIASDQVLTWDLHVEDGKVTESTGGSNAMIVPAEDQNDLDPYLSGEWLQEETQFCSMTISKGVDLGWDVEIVSPVSHGAYIFKTTVYHDAEGCLVYNKGKYWDVPITDNEEEAPLGEAKIAGTMGSFAFEGDEDGIKLAWSDDQHPEETIVFERKAVDTIPYWTEDSAVMESIVSFVQETSDENAQGYVPVENRIAVFDFDGTLFGELFPAYFDHCLLIHRVLYDKTYTPSDEMKAYALEMEEAMINRTKLPKGSAGYIAEAFKDMTVEEYRAYVRDMMSEPVWGFEGMNYGEGFYKPMVSLVQYLAEHDFTVFISSGSERQMIRELIEGTLDEWIPSWQVIGSEFTLTSPAQGDTADRDFDLGIDDEVIMAGTPASKNLMAGKVYHIISEIGKPPVLVFGNSSGDLAMAAYAVKNGGKGYMLLCDDTERDYGKPETAASFAQTCEERGFETVSMKNDFATIYGEDVYLAEEEALEPAA